MPISNVVERGMLLCVYNEKGEVTAILSAGGELRGYTGSSVTIRRGSLVYVYDEHGHVLSMTGA